MPRQQTPLLRTGSISYSDYPLEAMLHRVSSSGFDGLEIWKPQLVKCKTPELIEQFLFFSKRMGVEICALNDVDGEYFRPFESEYSFRLTLEGLRENVNLARALGVKDLLAWEGVRPKVWARDEGDLLKTMISLFGKGIEYSSKYGVRFIVEPHPFSLGMNLDFLTELCDSLDSKYFGVLYDSCHFGVGKPKGYIDAIRVLGNRIKHIHFSDSDQRTSELHYPLGKGRLDIDGIVSAFAEIGYSGTISLDTFGYPLPDEAGRIGLPVLKKTIKKLGLDRLG
jgi:sugar phosphate isomerase/epimerase